MYRHPAVKFAAPAATLLSLILAPLACMDTTEPADETATPGSTGSTAPATTAEPDPPSCDAYCELVSTCQGELEQYNTQGPCRSFCAHLPVGTPGDATGNSVACRQLYAERAVEAPAMHCTTAGPWGGDICGGACQAFCEVTLSVCSGELAPYDSLLACTTACQSFDPGPPYSSTLDEADTLACRIKHLTYATLDPDTHCSHVAATSPVCK